MREEEERVKEGRRSWRCRFWKSRPVAQLILQNCPTFLWRFGAPMTSPPGVARAPGHRYAIDLAWADDLVVLSLDPKSLQKQINIVERYCTEWGLEVNISKIKFMEMNGKSTCTNSWRPTLNGQFIKKVTSYCYLGVVISRNGKLKFNKAADSLYHKGVGAYFSLRSTIDRRFIKAGVAELGGPGGPWPPQKFEWVGQGMFWPPQNFDHWPPKMGGQWPNSLPNFF